MQAPKPMDNLARVKTVQNRLKRHYHYPDVSDYRFDQHVTWNPPLVDEVGFPFPEVTFRYTNIMDAMVSLITDSSLHGNRTENFVWKYQTQYTATGQRSFTRDLNSGDWWGRTDAQLRADETLLVFLMYCDVTQVTGSGMYIICSIYAKISAY